MLSGVCLLQFHRRSIVPDTLYFTPPISAYAGTRCSTLQFKKGALSESRVNAWVFYRMQTLATKQTI
jgi:hypothetical protein